MIAHLHDVSGAIFALTALLVVHVSPSRRYLLRGLVVAELACAAFLARALGLTVPLLGLVWGEVTTIRPVAITLGA